MSLVGATAVVVVVCSGGGGDDVVVVASYSSSLATVVAVVDAYRLRSLPSFESEEATAAAGIRRSSRC